MRSLGSLPKLLFQPTITKSSNVRRKAMKRAPIAGSLVLDIFWFELVSSTYDHRVWRTGLPVRSAVLKPHAGQLVVWWVTTCESWLLYVFVFVDDRISEA